jgi:hypothetical protein
LKKIPRKTVAVVNPHDKKTENYEGVLVEDLLNGYRVVFSIAELDSGIVDSGVIVADTLDGAPLPAKQGPLRVVAPHEKRAARWVRMLKSITVVRVSTSQSRISSPSFLGRDGAWINAPGQLWLEKGHSADINPELSAIQNLVRRSVTATMWDPVRKTHVFGSV